MMHLPLRSIVHPSRRELFTVLLFHIKLVDLPLWATCPSRSHNFMCGSDYSSQTTCPSWSFTFANCTLWSFILHKLHVIVIVFYALFSWSTIHLHDRGKFVISQNFSVNSIKGDFMYNMYKLNGMSCITFNYMETINKEYNVRWMPQEEKILTKLIAGEVRRKSTIWKVL